MGYLYDVLISGEETPEDVIEFMRKLLYRRKYEPKKKTKRRTRR
jgi:hypothetical protein